MRLNICCSNRHLKGFINVDRVPPADQIANLDEPWPWPDSSVDAVIAYDAIEHMRNPLHTMNELWRVLKPGARADIIVPTTDGRGWAQDPTHRAFPPFNRNSFFYYTHGDPHRERFGDAYGIRARFRVVSEKTERLRDEVVKLQIVLEAVK